MASCSRPPVWTVFKSTSCSRRAYFAFLTSVSRTSSPEYSSTTKTPCFTVTFAAGDIVPVPVPLSATMMSTMPKSKPSFGLAFGSPGADEHQRLIGDDRQHPSAIRRALERQPRRRGLARSDLDRSGRRDAGQRLAQCRDAAVGECARVLVGLRLRHLVRDGDGDWRGRLRAAGGLDGRGCTETSRCRSWVEVAAAIDTSAANDISVQSVI